MGEVTGIGWTDHTWSPWWGCTKVSTGEFGACEFCYAETLDKRVGGDHWGLGKPRREMSGAHWQAPLKWDRKAAEAGETRFVFPSMCDPFDKEVPPEWRVRFFDLIRATPNLTWLLLTKRPPLIERLSEAAGGLPPNVMLGATVVTQAEADRDVPTLLNAGGPKRLRFLSIEPMLAPITLRSEWLDDLETENNGPIWYGLSWVIVGGESGARPRPMRPEWAASLRDQCQAAGVPFFFKQWGGRTPKASGKKLDGREWCERPETRSAP